MSKSTGLVIEVIGNGEGETILLGLPDGKWGVVDCFAEDPDDASSHPLLQRLTELGIGELEFVCLTHPHDDHFRGMRLLLERKRVRHFWRPAGMTADDIRTAVMLRYQGRRSRMKSRRAAADEYPLLLRTVSELSRMRSKKQRLVATLVTARQQLYPHTHVDPRPVIKIESYSPSGDSLRRYFDQVTGCFGPRGGLRNVGVHVAHNLVSISLRLHFGASVVTLGGDVERSGWVEILDTQGAARLASHVVKVSHHGSTNGYCEGLWPAFSSAAKPTAIITPFHRYGLPTAEALGHIGGQAAAVLLTSRGPAARTPADAKVQLLLRSKFNISDPPPTRGGGCRIKIDQTGVVTVT